MQQRGIQKQDFGFNPRAHAGRDVQGGGAMPPTSCFNPRAHAGRDCMGIIQQNINILQISFREPTHLPKSHLLLIQKNDQKQIDF